MSKPKARDVNVESIIANPIYVGIGPFPKLVEEDVYIAAAMHMIEEHGAERYLKQMIAALRGSFDALDEEDQ